ncbi:MAG: NusG domain II-containing protein [Clostridiales bacterium]|jgi:hypothetical protein|nr:NusG domain II-containing protein [Clostridiales bacterium]
MKLKTTTLILVFSLLLVFSTAALILIRFSGKAGETAQIYSEGELLYEIDLSAVTQPYTIDLGGNTVLVEPGQISMLGANCPDKLCVRTGAIRNGSYPIVCLPNKVRIIIVNSAKDDIDAISG